MTSSAEKFGRALGKAVKGAAAVMNEDKPAPVMYRTNLRDVPKVEGLKRDDGWVDMQVQFLIDKKTADADHVVGWTVLKSVAASPVLGYRGPFILDGKMPEVPLADVTLQQKDMLLALNLGRTLGSPVPLAAAANEMMNACRGLGIDGNDFVVAHQVYRRLGGQE